VPVHFFGPQNCFLLPFLGLVQAAGFLEANLNRFITVLLFSPDLDYPAGACFYDSEGNNPALVVKNLGHSQFLA
jgi:hypothetical protein